jgi:hypothetical protein
MKQKYIQLLVVGVLFSFSTLTVQAQVPTPPVTGATLGVTDICTFAGNKPACTSCANELGVWTPVGCVHADLPKLIPEILKIAIGVSGGIAFLMLIYGGFSIMQSGNNPEKLNNSREIVTSAIAGLLLIIFSAMILKVIGIDLLKIPGLE